MYLVSLYFDEKAAGKLQGFINKAAVKSGNNYKRSFHYIALYDIESSKEKERWKFYVRDGKGGFKMVKDITAKSI